MGRRLAVLVPGVVALSYNGVRTRGPAETLQDIVSVINADSKQNQAQASSKLESAGTVAVAKKEEKSEESAKVGEPPKRRGPKVQVDGDADLLKDGDAISPPIEEPHIPPPDAGEGAIEEYHEEHHAGPAEHPIDYFVDATCHDICEHTCVPHSLHHELDAMGQATGRWLDDVMPEAVESSFEAVGDWIHGIGDAMFGKPIEGAVDAAEDAGIVPVQNVSVNGTVIPPGANATASLLARHLHRRHFRKGSIAKRFRSRTHKKDSSCLAECEVAINKCYELHPDVSDMVDQEVEKYEVDPMIAQCVDMEKLAFIQESGNLHYQLKYHISPSFQQIASLAEPLDHIDAADLAELGRCAPGGDAASINQASAQSLLDCMVGETATFADGITQGLLDITMNATSAAQLKGPLPAMSPEALTPSVKNGMDESVFYVNDIRCFHMCPGIDIKGATEECEHMGHCSTDFGELMFRIGILSTEHTMMEAQEDVDVDHKEQEEERGPAEIDEEAPKGHEHSIAPEASPAAPGIVAEMLATKSVQKARKHTKFAHVIRRHKKHVVPPHAVDMEPPRFCRAQMCAPYPASWIVGDWRQEMERRGAMDDCGDMADPVVDTHPDLPYEGTLEVQEEPEPVAPGNATSATFLAAEKRVAPTAVKKAETNARKAIKKMVKEAEKVALMRRKKSLARSMQAAAEFHNKKMKSRAGSS